MPDVVTAWNKGTMGEALVKLGSDYVTQCAKDFQGAPTFKDALRALLSDDQARMDQVM